MALWFVTSTFATFTGTDRYTAASGPLRRMSRLVQKRIGLPDQLERRVAASGRKWNAADKRRC
jgi:hypothetical protein